MKPKITIIIPTRNSGATICSCLDGLSRDDYPDKEIIIVDNRSLDRTSLIAEEMGASVIKGSLGRSDAKNLGVLNSGGKFILFLDSDQELTRGTLEECLKTSVELGADAVKIPELFTGKNFWGSCSALWKNAMSEAWGKGGGIPRFYKRSLLARGPSFDKDSIFWEDQDLYDLLVDEGMRTAWCRGLILHTEEGNIKKIVEKYFQYGHSTWGLPKISVKTCFLRTARLTLKTLILLIKRSRKPLRIYFGTYMVTTVKFLSFSVGLVKGIMSPK